MKTISSILMLAAFFACPLSPPALAATIQEIEGLPFDEAYQLWLGEQRDLVHHLPVIPSGTKDLKTGEFTPTTFWALTCRLGRDALAQESFLVSALNTNEYVSMILETSAKLCSRYGIASQAAVRFDPEHGYRLQTIEYGLGPEGRKTVWMKAMKSPASQPVGPADRSQPLRSNTIPSLEAARDSFHFPLPVLYRIYQLPYRCPFDSDPHE